MFNGLRLIETIDIYFLFTRNTRNAAKMTTSPLPMRHQKQDDLITSTNDLDHNPLQMGRPAEWARRSAATLVDKASGSSSAAVTRMGVGVSAFATIASGASAAAMRGTCGGAGAGAA